MPRLPHVLAPLALLVAGLAAAPAAPAWSARGHRMAGQRARRQAAPVTLDQLAYAWIMAHPSTPLPILGTNKLERIQAAAKAASIRLEREDWYALWVAAKGHGIP